MSFLDEYQLAQDTTFRARVRVAMETAAVAIQAEDPATANHARRAALALAVLTSPDAHLQSFAEAVCTNPVITAGSSDSDIQYTVNSMWNALAGN